MKEPRVDSCFFFDLKGVLLCVVVRQDEVDVRWAIVHVEDIDLDLAVDADSIRTVVSRSHAELVARFVFIIERLTQPNLSASNIDFERKRRRWIVGHNCVIDERIRAFVVVVSVDVQ